ncbi:MAG: DUF47 domain-containing protein [Omnitrophica WOR_2 bacterium]|jgi:predicted phosphate transport protein (TIGR00153 family)
MKLDKFFQLLVPKDKKFYPLFCQASANLVEATLTFKELLLMNDEEKRNELVKRVKKLEKAGDKITSNIFDELNSTFITPFDREDIHKLTSRIDTVVDLINTSARRIQMYKLVEIPPVFLQMTELLVKAAEEINKVTIGLNDIHKFHIYKENCVLIGELENESDTLNFSFLSEIFDSESNAISLIKKRDILNSLEKAMDRCEDVSDVFQTIIVKNA